MLDSFKHTIYNIIMLVQLIQRQVPEQSVSNIDVSCSKHGPHCSRSLPGYFTGPLKHKRKMSVNEVRLKSFMFLIKQD
jgi:hypothetical protein